MFLIVLKCWSTCQILMSSPTVTCHQLPNTILYLSVHEICCLKLILWCACFFVNVSLPVCTRSHLEMWKMKTLASQAELWKENGQLNGAIRSVHPLAFLYLCIYAKRLLLLILKCLFPDFLYRIVFSTLKLIQCLYFNLNICHTHTHTYLLTVL